MGQERAEVCRLAVMGPTSRVDVSVPTHVPLSDMMPGLLGALGGDLADRGLEHSGWIVQRLGETAFDESRTVADLELLDGDVVHVRPRTDQIPPLDYDDLVDGVSAGIRNRSGLWLPQTTRVTSLLLLAVWLGVGLVTAQLWQDLFWRPVLLAALVVLCSAAGLASVRGRADRAVAGIFGGACVIGTMLASVDTLVLWGAPIGGAVTAGTDQGPLLPRVILAGAGAGAVVALLVAVVILPRGGWRQVAAGLLLTMILVSGAAVLRLRGTLDWIAVAAIAVTVTTALRPAVPLTSFKLAGLCLPDMPAEPEDLQKDIEPTDSAQVLAEAAAADRFMTALYGALGLVSGSAMMCLAAAPGWAAPLVCWLAGAAQILATRAMTSTWHRVVLAGPALVAMAAWCLIASAGRGPTAAKLALAVCVVLVLVCVGVMRIPAGRRINPLWGRFGDWMHTLAVVATLPLVVLITGGVAVIRSRVG